MTFYDENEKMSVRQNKNDFNAKKISLLQFMEHECNHEFEKAKRCIFDKTKKTFDDTTYNLLASKEPTQFHPVFLSSLLNQ